MISSGANEAPIVEFHINQNLKQNTAAASSAVGTTQKRVPRE
jgi:hypothetical protein